MHLMIDVETLDVRPGSVVTQIGACIFDIEKVGVISPGININLDPQEQIDLGFKVGWKTLRWWFDQSEEAKASLPQGGGWPLSMGLARLDDYIAYRASSLRGVWGNGPDFDLTAVSTLYAHAKREVPWRYNLGRDCRTLAMVQEAVAPGLVERPEPEVAHNALSDAVAQALWVQKMWASLPGRSANGPPTAAAEGA